MPAILPLDDERLLRSLAEGEEPRVFVRQHPMALLRPALRAFIGTALWLWLLSFVPLGGFMDMVTVVVVVLWGHLLWSELERRHNFIGVTDKRVFRTEGLLFNERYPAMRMSKVTDVTLVRNVPGKIWGYAKIIIESAGQQQALHELDYLPYPEATELLWAELFGSQPRARRDRRRRHLPGRIGRRRDDPEEWDDDPDDGGGGHGPQGGSGGGPGAASAVREGDPRRGFRSSPRESAPYERRDPDVHTSGDWQAHGRPDAATGETWYQSPDRRPRTSRTVDTGPIPITPRHDRT